MRSSTFQPPSEESLAMMNIPQYREILEVTKRGFFHDLFARKTKQHENDLKKQENTKAEQTKEEPKPVAKTEKKPFWQSMKEIFKKKNK